MCNQLEQLTVTPDGTLCRRFHRPGHQPVQQKLVSAARRQELAAELHKGLNGGSPGTTADPKHCFNSGTIGPVGRQLSASPNGVAASVSATSVPDLITRTPISRF